MIELTLDFETYYDDIYSLKHMTGIEYITDPRFQVQCVGVQINHDPRVLLQPDELADFLTALPRPITLIAQNAQFDGLILFVHYHWTADRYVCTKSMARGLWPHESSSLKALCERLWPDDTTMRKGTELAQSKGVRDWDETLAATIGDYCLDDVRLTRAAYDALLPVFPPAELDIIHQMTRWTVAPTLHLDAELVERYIPKLETERRHIIANSGLWRFADLYNRNAKGMPQFQRDFTRDLKKGLVAADDREYYLALKVLNSNKAFGEWMTQQKISIPTKMSPTTGKPTMALAKNDPEFMRLMDAYPQHRAVWLARASAKSTTNLSRAHRFLDTAVRMNGLMPMPVTYGAAHTGRAGGAEKLNVQNMNRNADPDHPDGDLRPGALRRSLMAPEGYSVVVGDLSNIEARVLAYLADHTTLLDIFRTGGDPYCWQAASIYGRPIDKKKDKTERGVGKVVILGLGYGMGTARFTDYMNSGPMGMAPIYFEDKTMYARIVATYRRDNAPIVNLWGLGNTFISLMADPTTDYTWKMLRIQHQRIILPSGLSLQYPNLRAEDGNWVYDSKENGNHTFLHGAKLIENITQALANCVIKEAMTRADAALAKYGGGTVLQVHDEIVGIARSPDTAVQALYDAMTVVPTWAPGLPVEAEVDYAVNYCK